VGTLQARPDIGAVGPRIVAGADRRRTLHAAFFMHPWTGLYTMRESEVPMPCDWVNMTCALFRKEAYLKVGGFDVSFEHSQEEADLCLRLKAAGYGVLYQPRATAVHKVAPGTVRRERLYHFYRNKCWVIHKNFRGLRRLTALGFHAVPGTAAHLVESIRFHRTISLREWWAIFKATWDGLHR
jgi:GT2 family glycosyltransferase